MRNEPVETIEYKGYEIDIYPDLNPESPREWDNICLIFTAHRRCKFGDKNFYDGQKCIEALEQEKEKGDIVLPLYIYEHGGITISLNPFSCPWDSGQVGFVLIPRKKMLEEFGKKIFTKGLKERAMKIAEGEVKTLDQWLQGDVYGYVVKKDDEEIDSCWGFYGQEDCIEEAKGIVDWEIKNNLVKV